MGHSLFSLIHRTHLLFNFKPDYVKLGSCDHDLAIAKGDKEEHVQSGNIIAC